MKISQKRVKIRPRSKKRLPKFVLGENEKQIILTLGVGLFVVGSMVIPNLPVALRPIFKARGSKGFLKLLEKLRDKDVIYLSGDKIQLTSRGIKLQKQFALEEIFLEQPKEWDGIWRLISYDIPDKLKKKRDCFRATLIRLGFRKIQESLWVHPFDCREEIAVIAKDLGIASYVIVMITDHLPRQIEWEVAFNLKS